MGKRMGNGALAAAAAALALSCSGVVGDTSESAKTRSITGQLSVGALPLDNSVVLAQGVNRRKFVGTVARDGRFTIQVPAGGTYQLLVANQLPSGQLGVIANVVWPLQGQSQWAKLAGGAPLDLGFVQPQTEPACPAEAQPPINQGPAGEVGGTPGGTTTPSTPAPEQPGTPTSPSSPTPEQPGTPNTPAPEQPTTPGTPTPQQPTTPSGVTCGSIPHADLPYDARIGVGQEYQLSWSFLEKGPLPKRIVDVTMEAGGSWRLQELKDNTRFTVTQADCDHEGNRDIGRDRIEVTWENEDGSITTDHLDMRYCDGNAQDFSFASNPASTATNTGTTCEANSNAVDDGLDHNGICGSAPIGKADLPYDARIGVGMEYQLSWSFLEKGPLPAKILDVTMKAGGTWRLDELKANTRFTVTQADCDHQGNRDIGRDRIEVTWQNQDGSISTDHLDMRYCDGNSGLKFAGGVDPTAPAAPSSTPVTCEKPSVEVCVGSTPLLARGNGTGTGLVDGAGALGIELAEAEVHRSCTQTPPREPPMGQTPPGATCVVTADCADARGCFNSKCVMTCTTTCGATTCTTGP